LTVCSSGNTVTASNVTLPVASLNDWERYEGMLINVQQDLTATETFTLGRFGEVSLSVNGRLRNPTNVTTPGTAANDLQDLNNRSRILLDDGNGQQNIDPTIHPVGGLSAFNTLRSGYTVHGLTGVLEQRFGVYRVQPVGSVSFDASTNPRTPAPDPVGGNLKVAALNVLNFFTTLDIGTPICGPTGGLDCRGANSAFEFTRQRDKIINSILAIDPDIAGLMEVQNDTSATIQNLVDGLNDVAGAGTYAYINTGTIGTDAIKVAIIYQPAVVTPVGSYAILDSTVNPLFIDTKNRPTLAQTFMRNANGAKLTVVVNHLKSKGSDCNDVGDPDTGDGQGNCNLTRTKAATALTTWLATDPTGSGDPDFLVVGDMNSYAKEDPITTIKNAGYTNLLETLIGAGAYSYVFDGQSGYLDHALASASLTPQTSAVTEWHNNADEPTVLDYNVEFKTANQVNTFYTSEPYRASDHDPVVVGLNLNDPPTVDAGGPYSVNEGGSVTVTATGSDPNTGETLTYAWDLDNNGSFETPGQSATFDASTLTAPSSYTIRVQVTDSGGLTAIDTATVNVIYNFAGFFQPVDNLPTINSVKAGNAIPVKFSLSGDQGLNIFAAGYPKTEVIACDSTAPVDGIEETVTAGSSSLSYDASTDTYTYVWKTNKTWANSCRQLVVQLNDGTFHRANFTFTK
ncbi:MAG TPA: ExeM/NucH family extracellular endonuclease, partial [Roseiflexaceae bacterium]